MSLLAGSHGLLDGPSTAQGEDSPARLRPRSLWQSSLIAPGSDSPASRPEVISRGTGQFVGQGEVAVAAKTVKGADGVTINLLNAPVAQAAKTILGDVLKVNYVVSDKVAGTVTVQTTSPVEPAALVDIFEAVLKANGVALVRAEGHYRIVPLTAAGSSPVSLNGQAHGHGISTRIVPLRYIAAAEMRRVIEPMVEKGAILRVDDQRNLLVINGTGRELANFENLVSIFDVDWMRGMSFALFPVRTTEPDVIAKELETVFGLDKDGPLKGVVRIVPNGRLNETREPSACGVKVLRPRRHYENRVDAIPGEHWCADRKYSADARHWGDSVSDAPGEREWPGPARYRAGGLECGENDELGHRLADHPAAARQDDGDRLGWRGGGAWRPDPGTQLGGQDASPHSWRHPVGRQRLSHQVGRDQSHRAADHHPPAGDP
ncbi:MAG TPA: secretin N-terminal domain-containing protein [Hyphomicrobiaceae bacterium]|nr:secretin N-terminal domain-containing protein [Hyphomicrobiaceae bacterium]